MLMNTAAAPFGEQMEDMEPGTELDRYQVFRYIVVAPNMRTQRT